MSGRIGLAEKEGLRENNRGRLPLVSIIMPTYNRASLIGESISSVLDQSFTNFELIVVDDASSDNTQEVVSRFQSAKIRYFRVDKIGRSQARNFGLAKSNGEYIGFIDSDDLFLPNKLEVQIGFLSANPKIGMLYSAAYCIDDAAKKISCVYNKDDIVSFAADPAAFPYYNISYYNARGEDIYYDIAFYQPLVILLPTVIIKREIYEAIGGFDSGLDRFEDTDYWRRVSKVSLLHGFDEPTCKIRTHSGNTLSSVDRQSIFDAMNYYAAKVMREDKDKDHNKITIGLAKLYVHYAEAIAHQEFWPEALPFILKAFLLASLKPTELLEIRCVIPSLSECDIASLVETFMFFKKAGRMETFSPTSIQMLKRHKDINVTHDIVWQWIELAKKYLERTPVAA